MSSGAPSDPTWRIHHVQIAAPAGSESIARAFYGGILSLTEVPKPPHLAARGGIWLQVGGAQLHVGIEEPFRPATKAHPAFELPGEAALDLLRERLIAQGAQTWTDEPLPGYRRFYAADPFGNRLEFLAEVPPGNPEA
jgi:catechol 2,3-dioxygenase-like lactoylglutathione lyase family enzyme